ncbi:MAG: hypothetical protein HC827_14375 [Cyanobacteria bacterium RM1_2_2]|nr:hypothetical protein [Cyanobacteria bacterium RM1_2_2]
MTSKQPKPKKTEFKTPQPNELQQSETQEATRQKLAEKQGGETDAVTDQDSTAQKDAPTHSVDVINNIDNVADRHPLSIDSPPG